jgi:hypothetical protein
MKNTTEIPDENFCPCESGSIYSECCKGKIVWTTDGKNYYRRITLSSKEKEYFKKLKEETEKKLGHPVKPSDKIFPNLDIDDFYSKTIEAFFKSNTRAVLLYTYLHLDGLFVCESNEDKISLKDKEQHEGLYDEFYALTLIEKAQALCHIIKKTVPAIASEYTIVKCKKYISSQGGKND